MAKKKSEELSQFQIKGVNCKPEKLIKNQRSQLQIRLVKLHTLS